VSLEVEITDADGTTSHARVFNLSLSSMLVADLPFVPDVGSVHEFAFDIRGKRTVLRGVVRRRQNIPQFGNAAGVAFVGLPTAIRDALCDYLFGGAGGADDSRLLGRPRASGREIDRRVYVPDSHDARYFSCSGVRESMVMPMLASLSVATWRSISLGTG